MVRKVKEKGKQNQFTSNVFFLSHMLKQISNKGIISMLNSQQCIFLFMYRGIFDVE